MGRVINQLLLSLLSIILLTDLALCQTLPQTIPSSYPPVLQVTALDGFLSENAQIGTTVRIALDMNADALQVSVSDQDLQPGMPAATYQYILTGTGSTIFGVDQRGYIYLNVESLDADPPNPAVYDLTLQAREVNTSPVRSSQPITITINVLDANDNPPVFGSQVYTATTSAAGGSRRVLQISATDGDSGQFGRIKYRIVSVTNGGEGKFRYDEITNTLFATGSLIPNEQYQVLIEATDGGGLTSQSVVLVSVRQGMEQVTFEPVTFPPAFPSPQPISPETRGTTERPPEFTAVVDENTAPNTVVVSLGGGFPSGSVTYSIVDGNDEGRFRIDPNSGTISSVLPFDRETTAAYRLTVEAAPFGMSPGNRTVVIVTVTDVNDNDPRFLGPDPISFEVRSGVANEIVGRLVLEDRDEGANGRVRLEVIPPNALFSLDQGGVIMTLSPLPDFPPVYQLNVVAKDFGASPRQTRTTVLINVIAGENVPTVTTVSPFTVTEPYTEFVTLPITTTIFERDPPVFLENQYFVDVDENAGLTELGTVEAQYPDEMSGPITYLIRQGDPTLFSIDALTGRVRTLRNLDAESALSHTISVSTREAIESEKPLTELNTATVTIAVNDVNDWIPTFEPDQYQIQLPSGTPVGTAVFQVQAVDQDINAPNNLLNYRMIGMDQANEYFNVEPTEGVISVRRSLETTNARQMTLLIQASDAGQPAQSGTATIIVQIDRPESSTIVPPFGQVPTTVGPIFGQIQFSQRNYTTSVSEDIAAPGLIQILSIRNKPIDTRFVRCGIVSGNYGDVFSLTAEVEGDCAIRTQQSLDRETIGQYLLNVSVSDANTEVSDFAMINVVVLDKNDNTPIFRFNNDLGLRIYFGAISSTAPPFTKVVTVTAQDADSGNSSLVKYKLDLLTSDSQYFMINDATGDINNAQTMSELFGRRQPYFEFRVDASDSPTDGRSLSSSADVVVNVITDANRFMMTTDTILPDQMQQYIPDLTRAMRPFVGNCTLISVERMMENNQLVNEGKPATDILWYAVNPQSKKICKRDDFRNLFSDESNRLLRGEMLPWFELRSISEDIPETPIVKKAGGRGSWQAAPVALIVLAAIVAIGALFGIIAMCYFWAKYRKSKKYVSAVPTFYGPAIPKFGPIFLPPSEKIYETQMLEMSMADDDMGKNVEDEYAAEESIYSIQPPGRDPFGSHPPPPTLVIPPPDYPINGNSRGIVSSGKSML